MRRAQKIEVVLIRSGGVVDLGTAHRTVDRVGISLNNKQRCPIREDIVTAEACQLSSREDRSRLDARILTARVGGYREANIGAV